MAATVALPAARRAAVVPTVVLGGAAWLVLVLSQVGGWGRYLHHDGIAELDVATGTAVLVFVAGWVLMLTATMVPTTLPLVSLFVVLVERRPDRRVLVGRLVAGYVVVWSFAGLVAYAGDLGVHALAESVPALDRNTWVLAASALVVAGGYQLSALKERCLTRCRNPRALLFVRWRGVAPAREAFAIGTSHGATCLSCCWALMLVMFAVGAGSLGAMLGLGATMAAEKTMPGGARLRVPIGVGLLATAAIVAALEVV
jgi:predicted metal-binding membrane protein